MSTSAILTTGNHIAVLVAGEESSMPISVVQGQQGPIWSLTFKTADNNAFDLTGVTYTSAVLFDQQAIAAGTGLTLTGSFSTVSAANGTATFSPSAADVGTPGTFTFEAKITKSTLPHYFRCPVTILPRYGA